jgi:hypothetical protein
MKSYWTRNELGVCEIYVALHDESYSIGTETESIKYAAPYQTSKGLLKYQAIELEQFALFAGDVVHTKENEYIFLCASKIDHKNDAMMHFIAKNVLTVDPFEAQAPQALGNSNYLIKFSDMDAELSSSSVERYVLPSDPEDVYFNNLLALMTLMVEYDLQDHQPPLHDVMGLTEEYKSCPIVYDLQDHQPPLHDVTGLTEEYKSFPTVSPDLDAGEQLNECCNIN